MPSTRRPSAATRSTSSSGWRWICARKSATRTGRVTVRIAVERMGTTSLTTRETVLTPSGEVAAQARVVTVRWDADQGKPIPFTKAERARLTAAMAG